MVVEVELSHRQRRRVRVKYRLCYFITNIALILLIGCQPTTEIPGIVIGDSMAPTILGAHWQIACEECQLPFVYSASEPDHPPNSVVCPNCGCRSNNQDLPQFNPPQAVAVEAVDRPGRWDVIAFQLTDGKNAGIKRVVGLPGEALEIKSGEIYVNDQILHKPWSIQKQMRIPVHDSRFQPGSDMPARWRAQNGATHWRKAQTEWSFVRNEEGPSGHEQRASQWEWLKYHHWRCCSHRGNRDQSFPIEDVDSFNQFLPRELNAMDDLFFEIEIDVACESQFGWQFYRGEVCSEFQIDTNQQVMSVRNLSPILAEPQIQSIALLKSSTKKFIIEFSSFDSRFIVKINGQPVFDSPSPTRIGSVAVFPLRIGAAAGEFTIHRLRIWRDIYYLAADTPVTELSAGEEQLIVLGDNVPVSIDSRHWANPGIDLKAVIGRTNFLNQPSE